MTPNIPANSATPLDKTSFIPPMETQGNVQNVLGINALQETMKQGIKHIHALIAERTAKLNAFPKGIQEDGSEREVLDAFLDTIGLEKNETTRYVAYMRVGTLREDGLENYLIGNKYSKEERYEILEKAHAFVEEYHTKLHTELIQKIAEKWLISPFYMEILYGTHEIGRAFNKFHRSWMNYLIHGVNKRLEERFQGDTDAVMNYLYSHDLLDKGHDSEIADRSYSVLKEVGDEYEKLAYVEAFPEEISAIIGALIVLIHNLESHEDRTFGQKEAYIAYLESLVKAFSESNTDHLVEKWAHVDECWMAIHGPFQIGHPLEFYEDKYRKAVAPEWDLRLQNTELFDSKIKEGVTSMFLSLAETNNISPESSIHVCSLHNLHNTGLYISSPALYYGAFFTGLPSAQIVPNDAKVSKTHGKKIFSFAENTLRRTRSAPKMKIQIQMIDAKLREKYTAIISGPDAGFYEVYDIETIGHEFGHALWMDLDTESKMNEWWNFKNIEEWKATTGGLVAFLKNPDERLEESIIVDLVMRTMKNISWMKLSDALPYYTEALIHLDILFGSGMVFVNSEGKIELNFHRSTLTTLKEMYFAYYEKLIQAYKTKENASLFLGQYTIFRDGYFLPKNENIRAFVEHYYATYEKIGNEVEESE